MVLMQPPGEPETNVKALQEGWQKIMMPEPVPAAARFRSAILTSGFGMNAI
ncbi:hypothetical protein ACZ87_03449 [Candidatus Erwinia dacicola]|uniref:Uncharacterized protein n=1 Tax=Candidatus Erwinia dacicola TaxID=252393 RepID=A0A328TH71_9GAMM|nr:hypothetical protein ACZ87_03449 [Candidatus Erwinia dacicola]